MQQILPSFILADLYPDSLVLVEDFPIINPVGKAKDTGKITPLIKESDEVPTLSKDIKNNIPTKNPIDSNSSIPIAKHKSKKSTFYLGDNEKNVTILVNEPNAVFLSDSGLDFLTKMLSACKLNIGDVAIVNIFQHPLAFTELKKILSPTICLLFNVVAKNVQLPFTIPHYQVQQYANCTFLMAPDLTTYTLENNDAKIEKTKLWISLKKIFNI